MREYGQIFLKFYPIRRGYFSQMLFPTWDITSTSHAAAPSPLDAQASCSPNDDLGWAPHHSMLFHKMT
jgi:hypothetical protein